MHISAIIAGNRTMPATVISEDNNICFNTVTEAVSHPTTP
jgi:hypothetical protein